MLFPWRRFSDSLKNHKGMTVTELMVSICITVILASVAIPSYITYVQQARVVSLIIPRLHLIEISIAYYYATNSRLPGREQQDLILEDINTDNLEVSLRNGVISLKIVDPDNSARLKILDGNMLIASPVLDLDKIVSWHLDGELADRLQINL
jgi:type II secretory pathway pseudopilin PulG